MLIKCKYITQQLKDGHFYYDGRAVHEGKRRY